TQRRENDQAEWLSGILDGKTTGAPLAFLIRNRDAQSGDYRQVAGGYRPSHADFTYERKFGIRDPRGGGRSSARETACRVAAGAVARQFIARSGITVNAFVKQVGEVSTLLDPDQLDLASVFESPVRCPDPAAAKEMAALIGSVRDSGDTVGG